jgi:hypothetical protein
MRTTTSSDGPPRISSTAALNLRVIPSQNSATGSESSSLVTHNGRDFLRWCRNHRHASLSLITEPGRAFDSESAQMQVSLPTSS